MRVLIHDLGPAFDAAFRGKFDVVLRADGKYAPCQGCFGCWTAHPAECRLRDSLQYVCRMVGRADELVLVTENCYGAYGPAVKNILDRSIGCSTPMSTYRGRQMHHTLRYGKRDLLRVLVHGGITGRERETFSYMAERNAVNYGYSRWEIRFFETAEELEGTLS